mmetsp:Transcript_15385/g.21619  ORF Transcript_15385/g.21619 Transcript_15385/m.21619 type:complete len:747 (+) Transcript_15385:92-2332(+)|eukprot:CAMPEP_0184478030 /NCGR_PEP_ID=MMETSP0113_2-20130426/147_1 /TAXON_ID=91329 /ORGANISM="Norrisiella sphaerica, Strain BC52" /LENGTH=746 /DNA_ID=CAMNT_0026855667 /DNA_START=104 /DNA_END=2344 /DNA_ORIENTATION=-
MKQVLQGKLLLFLFVLSRAPVSGYLLEDYENDYCWKTRGLSGQQDISYSICPEGISMKWIVGPPDTVDPNESFPTRFELLVDTSLFPPVFFQGTDGGTPARNVTHINLHICPLEYGLCSPVADVVSATSIITTTDALYANFSSPDENNIARLEKDIDFQKGLGPGEWVVVAHVGFHTPDPDGLESQTIEIDVAVGALTTVKATPSYLAEPIEKLMVAFAGAANIFCLIVAVLALYNRSVRQSIMPWLIVVNATGAIVLTTSIFFWNLYTTETTCLLIPLFVEVGYSLLFSPLFAEVLRYDILSGGRLVIGNSKDVDRAEHRREFRKHHLTIAICTVAGYLILDLIFLSIWLGAYAPLGPDSSSNKEFQNDCRYSNSGVAIASVSFAIKAILAGAAVTKAWTVRVTGYERAAVERLRFSITAIVCLVVTALIIVTAFGNDGDEELKFLVRSLAILFSSIFGVWWLFGTWKEARKAEMLAGDSHFDLRRQRLSTSTTEEETNSLSEVSGKAKQFSDLSSMKAFNRAFKSSIIRGYLHYLSLERNDSESVEFCSDVMRFREAGPTLEEAERIYAKYIDPDGIKSVNISYSARAKVQSRLSFYRDKAAGAARTEETAQQDEEKAGLLEKGKSQQAGDTVVQGLKRLFDAPFAEVRRLIYLNSWRSFRESEYGIAAAAWFNWMQYLDEHTPEEREWVAEDIMRQVRASCLANQKDAKDRESVEMKKFKTPPKERISFTRAILEQEKGPEEV